MSGSLAVAIAKGISGIMKGNEVLIQGLNKANSVNPARQITKQSIRNLPSI